MKIAVKKMRLKIFCLSLFVLLALAQPVNGEYVDNSDSRLDYARSVSALNQEAELISPDRPASGRSKSNALTLILFRTASGVPDFGQYEPDILIAGPHGCFTAAYADAEKALAAVDYLKTAPGVLYAELDGEVTGTGTPDGGKSGESDPKYTFYSQGAAEMGFRDAASWTQKTGEGSVLVAVIDSGVYPHPLLASRLGQSGYDYVDGDEDATSDTFGHGTHVAGVIVDCTPQLPVNLRPIRVLNSSGKGTISNTVSAVFEAAEAGCGILNMSLVSSAHSEALEDAILYALNAGCNVVISAGNSGDETGNYCPVHLENPGFIVVGACSGTIKAPVKESYSNYGASVDVYAFGSSIKSCSLSDDYTFMSGTSQAAPHVTALCSLMKLLFPSIGNEETENRVKALAGTGEVNVPNASLLVPQTMGASADAVLLPIGTEIQLMLRAEPETSYVHLHWSCDDEAVAAVDADGVLHCYSEGTTTLHGDGPAKADVTVTLQIIDDASILRLPAQIRLLDSQAFSETAARIVKLPSDIETVFEDTFENSRIETVFYAGDSAEIVDVFADKAVCLIIKNDSSLWTACAESGIPYLLDSIDP